MALPHSLFQTVSLRLLKKSLTDRLVTQNWVKRPKTGLRCPYGVQRRAQRGFSTGSEGLFSETSFRHCRFSEAQKLRVFLKGQRRGLAILRLG